MTFIENRGLKDREGSIDATGSLRTLLSMYARRAKSRCAVGKRRFPTLCSGCTEDLRGAAML